MATDYRPIACGFYDELGLRMMRGQRTTLVVRDEDETERTLVVRITDIRTEGDEEYAYVQPAATGDGGPRTDRIRLDRIVRVDDVEASDRC